MRYQRLLQVTDGAKVLGKLPVPGRPTNLDYGRAGAYCACRSAAGGCSIPEISLYYKTENAKQKEEKMIKFLRK